MQIDELIQLKKNLQLKFDFSEVRISADVQKFTKERQLKLSSVSKIYRIRFQLSFFLNESNQLSLF